MGGCFKVGVVSCSLCGLLVGRAARWVAFWTCHREMDEELDLDRYPPRTAHFLAALCVQINRFVLGFD